MARATFLIALAAAAALAVGCAGSRENGPVQLLVFGDPEELAAYRSLVEAYEREDPDAEVALVEASDRSDLVSRLSTSIAGGSPPDLFLINYRFYGQFASKGAIEPLDERLSESKALAVRDLYPQAIEAFRWQGRQLCLPQNISSLVVYYNRALFRRFDTPEPRSGWSWNELVATAGRLTRDAEGRPALGGDPDTGGVRPAIYGLGVEPTLIRVAPFVWSNGGELVDDDRRPTRLTLHTPESRAALQALLDLRAQGVVPTDEDVEAEDDESRFANGRLAMLLSSRRSTTMLRAISELDWDVAPLPRHLRPAGILHSDAYCMAAGSERKEAAWRFVEFALGEEGQRIVARTGRTVPSSIAVSRSRAFLDPSQPPRQARVFLDGIATIRRAPSISTWPEIEDVTDGVLENGMYLGQPVDEVIRELDRVTRPLFARAETP